MNQMGEIEPKIGRFEPKLSNLRQNGQTEGPQTDRQTNILTHTSSIIYRLLLLLVLLLLLLLFFFFNCFKC